MVGYDGKFIEEVKETFVEPVKETFYIFEENEATIVMLVNGREVKEFSTYGDIYGELTCISNALGDAIKLVESYGVAESSDVLLVMKHQVFKVKKKKVAGYIEGEVRYEGVGYPKILSDTVIWDSHQGFLKKEEVE